MEIALTLIIAFGSISGLISGWLAIREANKIRPNKADDQAIQVAQQGLAQIENAITFYSEAIEAENWAYISPAQTKVHIGKIVRPAAQDLEFEFARQIAKGPALIEIAKSKTIAGSAYVYGTPSSVN